MQSASSPRQHTHSASIFSSKSIYSSVCACWRVYMYTVGARARVCARVYACTCTEPHLGYFPLPSLLRKPRCQCNGMCVTVREKEGGGEWGRGRGGGGGGRGGGGGGG